MANKTVEEKYTHKDEIEHIRHRSGMYIGSTISDIKECFVIDDQTGTFVRKDIEYTAGMLKICDEVLSNSCDEHIRNVGELEKLSTRNKKKHHILNKISVTVTEEGLVTVEDNGGIPIEFHKTGKCYVPQFIFGQLRSGSNYDDTEDRKVAGLNGVGSTLANIFSTEFTVDTCDGESRYIQSWTNGMTEVSKPTIILKTGKQYNMNKYPKSGVVINRGMKTEKSLKVNLNRGNIGERGTKITFKIDMSLFPNEDSVSYGVMKLIERKCVIAAASNSNLSVTFNGTEYCFKTFDEYVKLYGHDEVITGKSGCWEYAIGVSEISEGNYNHSIVNGAECSQGTHVSMANSILRGHLKSFMEKKHKMTFTNDNISSQYVLYLNCSISKPLYDSQTKNKLSTHHKNFDGNNGGEQKILSKDLKVIEESTIVKNLIELYELNKNSAAAKLLRKKDTENRKKSVKAIHKLVDANAPLRERNKCFLWMFEGQSAANTFRSVREPKYTASYTMRGKVKNIYGKGKGEISSNAELNDIMLASGIRYDGKHDVNKLRFGGFVIAVDADVDGINICGQLLSFFLQVAPEIIEKGMLYAVNSPLYKLYKGSSKSKQVKYIYSQDEFDKMSKKGWNVEYFKGLGSLGKEEYEDMIKNPRLIQFFVDDDTDDIVDVWMSQEKNSSTARKEEFEKHRF